MTWKHAIFTFVIVFVAMAVVARVDFLKKIVQGA